jgi:DNA-directed RNA polymerase specialized sigma24 family protein
MDDYPRPASAASTTLSSAPPAARLGNVAVPDPEEVADLAARLQADLALRNALADQGFAGPAYALFENEFASYGHGLMTAWLATGHVFARCRQAGLGLTQLPVPVAEREDLVQETVAAALAAFKRNGLQQGGWRPEGGASLKTYFTGALCFQFANIWKKRLRARTDTAELPLEDVPPGIASPVPGPEDIAVQRDEIRRGLAGIDSERTRDAVVLASYGYEHEEIAEILGPEVTARAVEGYLRRHRRRMGARGNKEKAGD